MSEKNSEFADNLLLCNEETRESCFDDDGDLVGSGTSFINGGSDSLSEPPSILSLGDDTAAIDRMLERENDHLPRGDYLSRLRSGELDLGLRRDALDWMIKACAHHNFGDMCLYLAMNYLDRFISVYNLPAGKSWAIQLVAVACLSLAAKFDEVDVPSPVDLQAGEPRFLFEGKTIERMEVLVLNHLKWNMKAYTPFNFIEHFVTKMNGARFSSGPLITRSIQIIFTTIKGIDFLEFKPSEIGAAVAVYVSGEIQEAIDIDKALSNFILDKGRVVKCVELIKDLIPISVISGSSLVPNSPNGVLEAAVCLSFKSDETTTIASSSSPHPKRRKLD
ncbi:hypothetical protein ACP275_11G105900 [Erythranthe tilingii]